MLSWLDRTAECFGITRVQAATATGLLTEFGRKALSQMAIGMREDVAARAASCTVFGWSTLIYLVPQLVAGVAAGLVFRALNPADK
jgi:hypothetical protein